METSLTLSNVQLTQNSYALREFGRFGIGLAAGNFNGFQGDELAVHIPALTLNSSGIEIFSGGLWGPSLALTQKSRAFTKASLVYDLIGRLAVGDFNNDGMDDLAFGTTGNSSTNGYVEAGAVGVLYGSPQGLTTKNRQLWDKDVPGIPGEPSNYEYFGSSLSTGDFNGDGYDDLVAGSTYSGAERTVSAIYGSKQGLTTGNSQIWRQGQGGLQGQSNGETEIFGSALASGDFNGDGKDDLAIGDLREFVNGKDSAGAVNVLYGSNQGLTAANNQHWHQDSPGIKDTAEAADEFGHALAAADFNGDGKDDLVIGSRDEDINGINNTGAINVLYGTGAGLSAKNNQLFHQGSPGMDSTLEADDAFGSVLVTGDFNRDGYADLAVGVFGEDIGLAADAGQVNVLYGSANGLTTTGSQTWHQDVVGVAGKVAAENAFGRSLSAGDFNNDGYEDLAISAPNSDHYGSQTISDTGEVAILYGSANGLTPNLTLQAKIGSALRDMITGTVQSEIIHGQAGRDSLRGGDSDDILIGGLDSDFLYGDAGDDILFGGPGRDYYRGGAGADVFVISAGVYAEETIADFKDGEDRIGLSGISFSSLSIVRVGSSSTGIFRSGSMLALINNTAPSQITIDDFVTIGQTSMMGLNDVPFVQA